MGKKIWKLIRSHLVNIGMLVHVLIDQALSGQDMYNQNQVQNHHDRIKENSDNIMFHNDKDYSMP